MLRKEEPGAFGNLMFGMKLESRSLPGGQVGNVRAF